MEDADKVQEKEGPDEGRSVHNTVNTLGRQYRRPKGRSWGMRVVPDTCRGASLEQSPGIPGLLCLTLHPSEGQGKCSELNSDGRQAKCQRTRENFRDRS